MITPSIMCREGHISALCLSSTDDNGSDRRGEHNFVARVKGHLPSTETGRFGPWSVCTLLHAATRTMTVGSGHRGMPHVTPWGPCGLGEPGAGGKKGQRGGVCQERSRGMRTPHLPTDVDGKPEIGCESFEGSNRPRKARRPGRVRGDDPMLAGRSRIWIGQPRCKIGGVRAILLGEWDGKA